MSLSTVNKLAMLLCIGWAIGLSACSTPNSDSLIDPNTGKHAANWISTHPAQFLKDPSQCTTCHGADLHGGMSGVSCFSASRGGMSCHANGPGHADPAAWADPAQHGAAAKAAPNTAAMHGFSTCQVCHGADFTGGMSLTACASCHGGSAPHPTAWLPTDTYRHDTTNEGNAPVCFQCHANGKNSPIAPPPAPPAGTPPGCFNGTLCHVSAHTAGWSNPPQHGAHAKAAPNASTTSGFSTCQTCHGADFTGGTAFTACASCHGGSAPHPTSWLPTSTYKHNTTDPSNSTVCGLCHLANRQPPTYVSLPTGSTPGCFDNTLCHGTMHPAGWSSPAQHGAHAKAAPNVSTTSGFSTCQTCHGNDFTGGTSLQTCLNTAGCHGVGVMSPHPAAWLPGNTYEHNTTDPTNAAVCALCHQSAAGTPGCFNNTLCHGPQ